MTFKVQVDMVVDNTRNKMGRLSVQGAARDEILKYKLTSKIIDEKGPSGHPIVQLHGSRVGLIKYLTEVMLNGDPSDLDIYEIHHV